MYIDQSPPCSPLETRNPELVPPSYALSLRFQLESVDRTINILTEPILAVPGEEIILIIPNER